MTADSASLHDITVQPGETALALALDVTDHQQVVSVTTAAAERSGPIDLIKPVLPAMRERRSDPIINISSIARRSNPGSGDYSATNAALAGASDPLPEGLQPLGIRVVVVEPGVGSAHPEPDQGAPSADSRISDAVSMRIAATSGRRSFRSLAM